jgi:hypothetical protein
VTDEFITVAEDMRSEATLLIEWRLIGNTTLDSNVNVEVHVLSHIAMVYVGHRLLPCWKPNSSCGYRLFTKNHCPAMIGSCSNYHTMCIVMCST